MQSSTIVVGMKEADRIVTANPFSISSSLAMLSLKVVESAETFPERKLVKHLWSNFWEIFNTNMLPRADDYFLFKLT